MSVGLSYQGFSFNAPPLCEQLNILERLGLAIESFRMRYRVRGNPNLAFNERHKIIYGNVVYLVL